MHLQGCLPQEAETVKEAVATLKRITVGKLCSLGWSYISSLIACITEGF